MTLLTILLILAGGTFAQNDTCDYARPPIITSDSTFQLSTFQLPEFRRRALTTGGGLLNRFNSRYSHDFNEFLYSPNTEYDDKFTRNDFRFHADIVFSDIHYTRNRQKEIYIWSNINTRFDTDISRRQHDRSDSLVYKEKERNNTFDFFQEVQYRQINRRYLNENLFFEYSPRINYSFQPYNERIRREVVGVSPREEREHKHRYFGQRLTPQISLGIGYGRIEPVGDARHAIHILDALARRGVTSAHKSPDDIIRFAEFIAELKNKRFLDSRHRKIYEMKALDSFLLANGFRDTLSMEYIMDYVTTLEDFWVHGNESRHSGWRMSLYATPMYSFESEKARNWLNGNITEDIYRNNHILSTRFGINFAYEKPINLYWQNSFNSSLEYHLQNTKQNQKNNLRDEKHKEPPVLLQSFNYSLGQQISYHPTTRTSAFVNYGLSYTFSKQDINHSEGLTIEGISHNLRINTRAGASYFLSPQLQLNLLTSLHYDFIKSGLYYHYSLIDTTTHSIRRRSNFLFHFELSLSYTFY